MAVLSETLKLLRELVSILGVAGALALILMLLVAGAYFLRLVCTHGIEATSLFLPNVIQAWKAFLKAVRIRDKDLRVELLLEGLLGLFVLLAMIVLAGHAVLPWHIQEEPFTILLYGSFLVFILVMIFSIALAAYR